MVTYFVAREGNLNYKDSLSVYLERKKIITRRSVVIWQMVIMR